MNSHTKKILLVNITLLLISVGACLFIVYQINSKGNKLEEFITVIREQNAKEESFIRISRLVQETEIERDILAKSFFQDESDSITFLGDIESFASSIGLELTTHDLNKVADEDGKNERITMTFVYKGKEETVLEFTKLLENIPYHSWVDSLSLSKVTNNLWEGKLTLFITIQTP